MGINIVPWVRIVLSMLSAFALSTQQQCPKRHESHCLQCGGSSCLFASGGYAVRL